MLGACVLITVFFLSLDCSAKHNLKHTSDTRLSSYQLINKYGFQAEKHPVVTEDGYIVNLFRIPQNGPPVLLVHGIGDSSDSWLVLGPSLSLAFLLAERGYDVWLFNARGNKYSKEHVENISRKEYWQFSFEEMGSQDLPATVDYILQQTVNTKLSYVGFSQGTTIFLIMCSMRPEYNDKIKHAVLLAPVAWLHHIKFPFIKIITRYLEILTMLAEAIGIYEVYPSNVLLNKFHALVCNETSPAKILCDIEYYLNYGLNPKNFPKDKFPVIASHIPAGTSSKTFVHFMKNYIAKRFQRFDYNVKLNRKLYNSSIPPEYNMSLVVAPVSLLSSDVDWFSDYEDVHYLRSKLPNVKYFNALDRSLELSHLEFVYGKRVKKLVNNVVLHLL